MPKPSLKEKLLEEGLKVVLAQGYIGASVRDIVRAADVPLGSFTNHFGSKEEFARQVLDRYFAAASETIGKTLRDDSVSPLARLRNWLDAQVDFLKQSGFRSGCLIGNFSTEASGQSDSIRDRLREMTRCIEGEIAACLRAAADAGEIPKTADVDSLAGFIYSSWQGAVLQAKVEQSSEPLERFKTVLFSYLPR